MVSAVSTRGAKAVLPFGLDFEGLLCKSTVTVDLLHDKEAGLSMCRWLL